MKPISLTNRYIAALLSLGYAEVKPTTHYRVYRLPLKDGGARYIYIGKAGAVRTNTSGKASQTRDTSQAFKDRLLVLSPDTHTHYNEPIRNLEIDLGDLT